MDRIVCWRARRRVPLNSACLQALCWGVRCGATQRLRSWRKNFCSTIAVGAACSRLRRWSLAVASIVRRTCRFTKAAATPPRRRPGRNGVVPGTSRDDRRQDPPQHEKGIPHAGTQNRATPLPLSYPSVTKQRALCPTSGRRARRFRRSFPTSRCRCRCGG